jgi:hypothetical protein
MLEVLTRHRGPFVFMVQRKGKKGPETEWLKGEVPKEDVEEEALTILEDPRDSVENIALWSIKEEQFVTTLRLKDLRTQEAAA